MNAKQTTRKGATRTKPGDFHRISGADRRCADQLLMRLLKIPGPSGREGQVSETVQQVLREAGVKANQIATDQAHQRSPLKGDIGNLVVNFPGSFSGPRRLLMAHLDTVPICVGCRPVKRDNVIRSANPDTGLGADNRAGSAVLLATALRLMKYSVPHPPITMLWTVQEEVGLQGARLLKLGLLKKPRFAFNWDGGSAAKITIGATGGYRMEIVVRGHASHAGNAPERGVSAIGVAAVAIADLQRRGWHGAVAKKGKVGTSNIGVIEGGAATNVVADHVRLLAEARSHDPDFRQQIVTQIEDAFQHATQRVTSTDGKRAEIRINGRLDYESFCLPTDHVCVAAAKQAVQSAGRTAELAVANGGLDANWLTARGIPTVSLGCGQKGQHTVEESMDLREYHSACEIAMHLATDSLDNREGGSNGA
ncbi:MAG: peptidase M20 [Planctomycetaceae bacterium]|nr:peptidase M20 [Planctomycetaceae bacterium]